jgi:chitin synthase
MASLGRSVGIYRGLVYNVTNYITYPPATRAPYGQQAPQVNVDFMDGNVLDLFKFNSGSVITKQLNNLNIDSSDLSSQKVCLRNLFTTGAVDNRNLPQYQFSTYILLALSVLMVCVIGFKFLASINFSSPRAPEAHDKFVICQVPCYTVGDASLRRTIDSLAQMKYDDKRKLLVVICDSIIVGSGNDKPTPRIVLDILGADPNQDPEPLSFQSLGAICGNKCMMSVAVPPLVAAGCLYHTHLSIIYTYVTSELYVCKIRI